MASPVWFFIASLFLVSTNGKAIGNGVESYYDKPESSSPAPQSSASSGRKQTGLKELVLYLTPDQVEVLEGAGAVVKPFPQFEKTYLQQQQSAEEQTQSQEQADTSDEEGKQDPELEEFYKFLNAKKINEDLGEKGQPAEQSTEKPRPKYKYTSKSRQQDYAALYVQKKANRGKTSSTEYVRYLPNYEVENLKMESYRAKPVPGYRFDISPENLEIAKYLLTEAPEIKKFRDNPQEPEESQSSEEDSQERTQQQVESPVEPESSDEDTGPVTFEGKVQAPAKVSKFAKTQQPAKVWAPTNADESAKAQDESEEDDETRSEEEVVEKIRALAKEEVKAPKKTSAEIQRQVASLLAPLLQHKKITEAIAKEKEELAKNEKEIQNKLKELKESGNHDEEKYAIELRKLNENLERQNALAEKLAHQGIVRQSEPQVTENVEEDSEEQQQQKQAEQVAPESEPKKTVQVNDPTPIVFRIPDGSGKPQLYPVTLDFLRSLPVPVQNIRKVAAQRPVEKRIRIPETSKVYFRPEKPYLVQPDTYTILRHIWEH